MLPSSRRTIRRHDGTSALPPVESFIFQVALELDEAFDFFLRRWAELTILLEDRVCAAGLIEEVADAQIEALKNLQKRIEADLVFALLHAGEVRLMDADLLGQLHLGQLSLPAKLPDLATYELELCW